MYCVEDYLATAGGAAAVLPSSWPAAAAAGYQMVPTLYAADAATAGGFYNQTAAFVPQLAVTQMSQVRFIYAPVHCMTFLALLYPSSKVIQGR